MENPIQRSIWTKDDYVQIIDQRFLPHKLLVNDLKCLEDCERAIKHMEVRGAPLIGITAAFGMYFAAKEWENGTNWGLYLKDKSTFLKASRPTAVNLMWAVDQMLQSLLNTSPETDLVPIAWNKAIELMEDDAQLCKAIGRHGLTLIEEIFAKNGGEPVQILTHCNAGSLACIEWGTATSPIYQAQAKGIPMHVWVDETRPRNQGANLTAWELGKAGVTHSLIVDNAGGHLMQNNKVDIVFVGADRVTSNGDAANKIGTYLKALAAKDNNVPFYVCLPSSTIDWSLTNGLTQIEIEERDQNEVRYIQGMVEGELKQVLICPETTMAHNAGFDITPARLISGLITERGICSASPEGLKKLYGK